MLLGLDLLPNKPGVYNFLVPLPAKKSRVEMQKVHEKIYQKIGKLFGNRPFKLGSFFVTTADESGNPQPPANPGPETVLIGQQLTNALAQGVPLWFIPGSFVMRASKKDRNMVDAVGWNLLLQMPLDFSEQTVQQTEDGRVLPAVTLQSIRHGPSFSSIYSPQILRRYKEAESLCEKLVDAVEILFQELGFDTDTKENEIQLTVSVSRMPLPLKKVQKGVGTNLLFSPKRTDDLPQAKTDEDEGSLFWGLVKLGGIGLAGYFALKLAWRLTLGRRGDD